ncbi:MAG: GNAT family N-acetyltransferase [Chloroflexi bacterium]|nr:GNAT family N-acetyltransferase [Chloroflexota bacterium]
MTIQTARLELKLMTAAFMQALLDGVHEGAAAEIGYKIPADWELPNWILERRIKQLAQDTKLAQWQLRVMALKQSGVIVGHIGFHTRPGPKYLAKRSPGGVELGYAVFEQRRRKGYASEAVMGLLKWAHREHGVQRFIFSIDPDNQPSLGLARKLGFKYLDTHIDPDDGPEDIMEYVYGEHE